MKATLIATVCVLALSYALKQYYATASASELAFVLAPSCWLASHLYGVALAFEPGQGYVSHRAHLIVGPACAGINFLVVAFLALFFTRQAAFPRVRAKLGWGVASLCLAYLVTALANGTRIALAAQLGALDIYGGMVTHERVHRLLGVVTYLVVLLGLCSALARRATYLVPLGCYAAVAVFVPLGRLALGAELPGLYEHLTQTCAAALAVAFAAFLCERLLDRLLWNPRWRSRES